MIGIDHKQKSIFLQLYKAGIFLPNSAGSHWLFWGSYDIQ